jgi:SAM-dependent methyltransferase
MAEGFYETAKALSEYLLFHYGKPEEVLPWDFGPSDALDYPARCVSECVAADRLAANARALDLGCAVGRSTFELARHCAEAIGIDLSENFIAAAGQLQRAGQLDYSFAVEGDLGQAAVAEVPSGIDRSRVSFEQGDATFLRDGFGQFDVVLMANLIDRLPCPAKCLELEEYTPKAEWLGGQAQQTLDTLRDLLSPAFTLDGEWNLPFLIREHARKYQWSIAQATRWVRQ